MCGQPVSLSQCVYRFLVCAPTGQWFSLTGKFLASGCGQWGRWAETQRRHLGASPPKGSPDWHRDRCWNRHCATVGGVIGAPHHPAWHSRSPGVPGSPSPGKARRWRVSGGSWFCVPGRDDQASSRHPNGPARCTRLCSFLSLPRQGWNGYLWAREKQTVPSESFILIWTSEKRGIFEQKLCHLKHHMHPPMSLQLLLSSRQQLLCSSCYAVCNEHNHVCCPQADVLHSGDGMLHLCHLDISKSSSSGTLEMDPWLVEAPNWTGWICMCRTQYLGPLL